MAGARAADSRKGCKRLRPFSPRRVVRSFPGHSGQVVGEDRRVLPQAVQLGVGDDDLRQLEQERVDAIVRELLLRLAERRLIGGKIGSGGQPWRDVAELLAVVLEVIVRIGVDADVERLDMADDRQIVVLVLVDAGQPLRPFDVFDLRVDSDIRRAAPR